MNLSEKCLCQTYLSIIIDICHDINDDVFKKDDIISPTTVAEWVFSSSLINIEENLFTYSCFVTA